MVHEVTFNSKKCPDGEMIHLASGYVSQTTIEFTNENVTVSIEAKTGRIDFHNLRSNKQLSHKMPLPLSGDEKFSEVKCIVEKECIKLGFPQYTYVDHYPHCDGEYDRWTKTISGFVFLCYDFQNDCLSE